MFKCLIHSSFCLANPRFTLLGIRLLIKACFDQLKIFFKITFPQMKWALLYGVILCTSRALGEFGAVNALSKTRGETFTLPLEIDALYMSGTEQSVTAAFAVSSLLVILAVIILFLRNILEYRAKTRRESR